MINEQLAENSHFPISIVGLKSSPAEYLTHFWRGKATYG